MPRLVLRWFATTFLALVLCVSATIGAFASTTMLVCACPTEAMTMGSQTQHQDEAAATDQSMQGMPCNFICLDCTSCVSCVLSAATPPETYVLMPDLADTKDWASPPEKASRFLKPAVPPPIAVL